MREWKEFSTHVTVVAGVSNDIVALWVNPDPSTFGAASAPTPTILIDGVNIIANEADVSPITSFLLANRNTGSPNLMFADEVRLGTNWAQVTSTNVVSQPVIQPTLTASVDPSTVQLLWGTNSTGFTLQSSATLLSTNTPWGNVGGSATVSGTNYVQTDAISGTKFYRLKQ
jgi:hypothetical protein